MQQRREFLQMITKKILTREQRLARLARLVEQKNKEKAKVHESIQKSKLKC